MTIKHFEKINTTLQLQMQQELQALSDGTSGVVALVLATVDGFSIASVASETMDTSRIAALASSMSAIGQVAANETQLGSCKSLTIDTSEGFMCVFAMQIKNLDLVLTVLANSQSILAQVIYKVRRIFDRLAAT
jgi:predicted regulator of Ras-like GTPase activity (Roadblock/LC7/MglB family)